MSNLLERLASLREKNDTRIHSEDKSSVKLSTFLYLYSTAQHECYINYMEGAKALLNYLAPAGQPLDLEIDKYPEIANPNFRVPNLLKGYESHELAKLISGKTYGSEHRLVLNAIYFVMSKDVIIHTY